MNKLRVTFKRNAQLTGLAGIARPFPDTEIKINGKYCGDIISPDAFSEDNKYRVTFIVYKSRTEIQTNCLWKRILIKRGFDDELTAREYVKDKVFEISKVYKFYFMEED